MFAATLLSHAQSPGIRSPGPVIISTLGGVSQTILTNGIDGNTAANGQFLTNAFIGQEYNSSRMPVPPRIWGTWYDFTTHASMTNGSGDYILNADYIITQARWMATNGMRAAGCEYIFIVEGWNTGTLDTNRRFVVNSNMFPDGIEVVINAIKTNGLKPVIYTSGFPYGDVRTCMNWVGTSYTNAAIHMQQFADWGFDGVFVDSCTGYVDPTTYGKSIDQQFDERVRVFNEAILRSGRKMWLHVVPPQTVTTPSAGYLPDRSMFSQLNGTHWGTPGWDFVGSQDPQVVCNYFATNGAGAGQFTTKGTYFYFGANHRDQYGFNGRLVTSLHAMLAGAIYFNSPIQRWYYLSDPVTYAPSTWMDSSYAQSFTNVDVQSIHQDPAVIPGKRVWTNATSEIWVRQLGSYISKTQAVFVANHSASAATVTIPANLLLNYNNEPMIWRDCWAQTNSSATTGDFVTGLIPPTNHMLFKVFPQSASTRFEPYSFRQATLAGTGASINTAAVYGPANWYNVDGIAQTAANNGFYFLLPAPMNATRATMALRMYSAGGAVAWTNRPNYEYYNATTRVQRTPANDANLSDVSVITTSGQATWVTNTWLFTVTNAPKMISLEVQASTNTSARYIIGPAYIQWEY